MRRFLDRETLAAVSTFLGFTLIAPAFILFRSKDEFVRFWAAQSLAFFILVFLADWVVLLIRVFNFLPSLIFIITVVIWLTMVYKSWIGDTWQIPLLGRLAKRVYQRTKS